MALRSTTRSYRGEPALVDSDVDIAVRTYGDVPEPTRRPEIVARIGVGLNPFGVENSDDLAWLTTLTWPEHVERRDRMRAAADVVATDRLDDALALGPDEATPVVFHSAVLNCSTPPSDRRSSHGSPGHHESCGWPTRAQACSRAYARTSTSRRQSRRTGTSSSARTANQPRSGIPTVRGSAGPSDWRGRRAI